MAGKVLGYVLDGVLVGWGHFEKCRRGDGDIVADLAIVSLG